MKMSVAPLLPVVRIWEPYERNPTRSLAPVNFHRDLAGGVRGTVQLAVSSCHGDLLSPER
jgi:hypothetical protein